VDSTVFVKALLAVIAMATGGMAIKIFMDTIPAGGFGLVVMATPLLVLLGICALAVIALIKINRRRPDD
jgi:hypothetical protein